MPVGEDDGRVVSPLEVHLHVSVMEPDPELVSVWQEAERDHQGRNDAEIRVRKKGDNGSAVTLIQNSQNFPSDSVTALEQSHDLKNLTPHFRVLFFSSVRENKKCLVSNIFEFAGDVGRKCRETAERYH